jgi:tetratricopeptide (TPR) repeat protein
MGDTLETRRKIEAQFESDPLLRPFLSGSQPTFEILVSLLLRHIPPDQQVRIRYLEPGKSGAVVLLLLPERGALARVVKVGREDKISAEFENHARAVHGQFPGHLIAVPADPQPNVQAGWASLSYFWAGGYDNVEQIRTVATSRGFALENLIHQVVALMWNIFDWYKLCETRDSPDRMWEWRDGAKERVRTVLREIASPEAKSLLSFLDDGALTTKVSLKTFSKARRCHGDVSCHNVVFSGPISGWTARFIDFGSILEDQCPAYDWAKLERDLRFKCASDLFASSSILPKVFETIDLCLAQPSHEMSLRFTNLPVEIKNNKEEIERLIRLIRAIRLAYAERAGRVSDSAQTEYLWFLLYWQLAYLDSQKYHHEPAIISASIKSAFSTYSMLRDSIESSLRHDPSAEIGRRVIPLNSKAVRHRIYAGASVLLLLAVVSAIVWTGQHKINPPSKTIILVLEFDGPEPAKYKIGHIIATKLGEARGNQADIKIENSNHVIKIAADNGSEEALRLGRERGATAVIWGYYTILDAEAQVNLSFEPVIYPDAYSFSDMVSSQYLQSVPLPRLETGTFRTELAVKMTPLVMLAAGLKRFEQGDFNGFASAMDQAQNQNPDQNKFIDSGYLYYYHAVSRLFQFDYKAAIRDFDSVLRRPPTPKIEQLALAYKSYLSAAIGDYQQAADGCLRLGALDNRNFEAIQACVDTEWVIGDESAARALADRIFQTTPGSGDEFVDRGALRLDFCEYENVKSDIGAAKRLDSDNRRIALLEEALKVRSRESVMQLNTTKTPLLADYPLLALSMAPDYATNGQSELAISAIKRLIDYRPSAAAYMVLASLYEESEPDKAISATSDAIRSSPPNPWLLMLRAYLFQRKQMSQPAYKDLQLALRFDPSEAHVYVDMADVLFAMHRDSLAREYLKKAVNLQPTYAEAYADLARAAVNNGDWKSAYIDYSTSIELTKRIVPPFGYPPFRAPHTCPLKGNISREMEKSSYLKGRALAALALHKYATAESDIAAAKALTPNDSFLYYLGSRLTEQSTKDYAHALQHINRAIELSGSEPIYYSQQGSLFLLRLNQPDKAIPGF